MKKAILPIFLMLIAATTAQLSAQKILGLGQLGLGVPMGDFSDKHDIGFSVIAQGRYELEPKLWLTGALGYQRFSRKETTAAGSVPVTYSGSASVVPVVFGGIYEIGEGNIVPYISAEFGLFFLGATIKTTQLGVTSEKSYSRNEFGLIPGAGILYPLNEKLSVDVAVKYHWIFGNAQNDVTDINFFSINAGLQFPL